MLNDRITGMSALPGGKVVITGESMYSQSKDFVTVCYSEQGLELWVNAVDGKSISMESATVQDIDPFTGDIYLAGYAKGRNLNSDMLTVKYKADGSFQWARYFEGPALEDDIASDIKTDGQGNVYVAGRTTESMAPRVNGLRLIKYDEQGNIVWNVVHADTGYMTEYPILAIGNDGSIYVCAGSANFTMSRLLLS
jgi:hypothetical protein